MSSFAYRLAAVAVLGAGTPWLKAHTTDIGYVLAAALYLAAMIGFELAFRRWRSARKKDAVN